MGDVIMGDVIMGDAVLGIDRPVLNGQARPREPIHRGGTSVPSS